MCQVFVVVVDDDDIFNESSKIKEFIFKPTIFLMTSLATYGTWKNFPFAIAALIFSDEGVEIINRFSFCTNLHLFRPGCIKWPGYDQWEVE